MEATAACSTHRWAGRVHQHVVADGVAFWVQALKNAQRTVVLVVHDAALCLVPVGEFQVSVPTHGHVLLAMASDGALRTCGVS